MRARSRVHVFQGSIGVLLLAWGCGHIGVDEQGDGDGAVATTDAELGGAGTISGDGDDGGSGLGGDDSGTGASSGSGGLILGAGGMAPQCVDEDGDGETTCAGDCDDSDGANSLSGVEICGDGADNNCDGIADEICNGSLGTFVSALIGLDTNPGTQAEPVKTIKQGISNAIALGGPTAVVVAEGTYYESIAMVEGVSLLGGHQCDTTTCSWTRDRVVYESIVRTQGGNGVLIDATVTRATRLEGFRLIGQDGGNFTEGRSTINVLGGAPTIVNNRIIGAANNGGTWLDNRSIGIRFSVGTVGVESALVEGNEIAGGLANGSSLGIVLETWRSDNLPVVVDIINNVVRGGQGENTVGVAIWAAAGGVLVEGNDIGGGAATTGSSHGVAGGGQFIVNANLINVHGQGSCGAAATNFCSGFHSESATATVTNNVIVGADAPKSAGVLLSEFEAPAGRVILANNTIDGGGSAGQAISAALGLQIGTCNTCGFNASVGRVRNNILQGGSAAGRFGVYEDAPAGKDQHPEIFEYNLFWIPQMTNSDHLYRFYDATYGESFLDAIGEVDNLQNLALRTTLSGNNLAANPLLDGSHRLSAGSPAIDRGTTTTAPPTDRDGDARPVGNAIDIGADEAR